MTHVEAYRTGMKIVRETAGKDVFILGCNLAQNMRILGPSIGFVDAMRIGPDNKAGLVADDARPVQRQQLVLSCTAACGTTIPTRCTCGRGAAASGASAAVVGHAFRAAACQLVLLRRPAAGAIRSAQAGDSFARFVAAAGGFVRSSGRRGSGCSRTRGEKRRFMWSACSIGMRRKPSQIDESFKTIGLPAADKLCDVRLLGQQIRHARRRRAAHDVGAGFLPDSGRAADGGSAAAHQHVAAYHARRRRCGRGSWDAAAKTLDGVSRVVGGDPYELRIAKPASGEWKLVESQTVADARAQASIKIVGEEPLGLARADRFAGNKKSAGTCIRMIAAVCLGRSR